MAMLFGALAATGAATVVFLFRDKLCKMANTVGSCACACADNCGQMMTELKNDMEGK